MTLDHRRLFRCGYCGQWRYYLNRPCSTCAKLARRHYLKRENN